MTARRVSTTTWEIEAGVADRALLVSNILRKKGTDQQDWPCSMPFVITVVSPVP